MELILHVKGVTIGGFVKMGTVDGVSNSSIMYIEQLVKRWGHLEQNLARSTGGQCLKYVHAA